MPENENLDKKVKTVVKKNVSHAQKNKRSVVDSKIEIRVEASEIETETENETGEKSFLSKINLSLDSNGDPKSYISDIGKLVQLRLKENVTKRTFSDLNYRDYMRTGHQYETVALLEFETETKSDECGDIFSLEIDRLNRIQVGTYDAEKTTEICESHKPFNLFLPDKASSKISESGSKISPFETGLNMNQHGRKLSNSFGETAFETIKNHIDDEVCSNVIIDDVALSAINVNIDDTSAQKVDECSLDLHTQSHLHLTLSTTEDKEDIRCDKKELIINNTIQNYNGAANKGKKMFPIVTHN